MQHVVSRCLKELDSLLFPLTVLQQNPSLPPPCIARVFSVLPFGLLHSLYLPKPSARLEVMRALNVSTLQELRQVPAEKASGAVSCWIQDLILLARA